MGERESEGTPREAFESLRLGEKRWEKGWPGRQRERAAPSIPDRAAWGQRSPFDGGGRGETCVGATD